MKEYNMSEEGRKSLIEANKNKVVSERTKERMRQAKLKNKPPTYFYNLDSKILECCRQLELVEKYNLSQSGVSAIMRSTREEHKGWVLLSSLPKVDQVAILNEAWGK